MCARSFLSAGFAPEPGLTAQPGDTETSHLSVSDLERASLKQDGTGSRQNKPGLADSSLTFATVLSSSTFECAPQVRGPPRGSSDGRGTEAGHEGDSGWGWTRAKTQCCRRPVRPSGAHVCHKGLQETNVDCLHRHSKPRPVSETFGDHGPPPLPPARRPE